MPLLAALLAATLTVAEPPSDCQAALGPIDEGTEESALPNQVDGTTIPGRDALIALRAGRGDALITVKGGMFARADFRGARLHNICFLDTDLSGSDWRGADAAGVGFVRANLTGADLREARLGRLLIRNSNLDNVNAERAVLAGGRLDGGWFDGSITRFNLGRADLTGFRFECGMFLDDGCPVAQGDPRISLRGANLTRANLFGYDSIEGARIDGTEIRFGQLADLAAAEIAGPIQVRGGDIRVELAPAELRALLPHIVREDLATPPSFDCARAANPAEQLICSADAIELRSLDRRLAEVYRAALARDPTEARAQGSWLNARNRCGGGDSAFVCLEQSYERRIAELAGHAAPPAWLRPGQYHLFVAPTFRFDEAFRADPLYRKLVPAIVGEPWSQAIVRINADNSLDVTGEAVGANGHSCSLEASGLRLDPATGWYSARPESGPMRGRPIPVLLVRGDWIEVYARGRADPSDALGAAAGDFASCGARAGFSDMLLMPVGEEVARRRFDEGRALH